MIDLRLNFCLVPSLRLLRLRSYGRLKMVKILGFFQFSKNYISETKLGRGLKFGIKIHLIGVYTYAKSPGSTLGQGPGVGTQNHNPKFGS